MAIFKFPSPVLPEGTTFVFGSWVCVANGAGGFRWHIVDDTIKLKTLASRLDDFVDSLDELPFFDSARETEAESVTTVPFSELDLDSLLQAGGSEATACREADDHHHLRRMNCSLEGDESVRSTRTRRPLGSPP
jgi:hypothetical protein